MKIDYIEIAIRYRGQVPSTLANPTLNQTGKRKISYLQVPRPILLKKGVSPAHCNVQGEA